MKNYIVNKMVETQTIKKVTPYKDITWYVKWASSICLLIATSLRAASPSLHLYDMLFSIVGLIGWLYVGLKWNDRALILLNGVISVILFGGIVKYLLS
jgi:hypothetical protein